MYTFHSHGTPAALSFSPYARASSRRTSSSAMAIQVGGDFANKSPGAKSGELSQRVLSSTFGRYWSWNQIILAAESQVVCSFSFHEAWRSPAGVAVLSVTGTMRSWKTKEIGGSRVGALSAATAARFPPLQVLLQSVHFRLSDPLN